MSNDFYEEDEPVEKIQEILQGKDAMVTVQPSRRVKYYDAVHYTGVIHCGEHESPRRDCDGCRDEINEIVDAVLHTADEEQHELRKKILKAQQHAESQHDALGMALERLGEQIMENAKLKTELNILTRKQNRA